MKKLLFICLFISGCAADIKQSDNETLKKMLGWEHIYIFEMFGRFQVSGGKGNLEYSGEGSTLQSAYEDSLKHITMTCKVKT